MTATPLVEAECPAAAPAPAGTPRPAVSIVIPSWNGRHLLERYLPAVLAEADAYRRLTGAAAEVLVVDDGSTDDTAAYLARTAAAGVRMAARRDNGGFSAACNTGFAAAAHPVVVLLNNDVEPEAGFLPPLLEHFRDPAVFGVTCRVLLPGTRVLSTAGKVGMFRRGYWSAQFNYEPVGDGAGPWPSFTAIGGFAALDRGKVLQLGGFLEIFNPFYWEDIDLSYRAWKRGWEIRFEPRSVVYHQPSATIGRAFERRRIATIAARNRLLFHWLEIRDPVMLGRHAGMLALQAASQWAGRRREFYGALAQALRRLPEVRRLRRSIHRGEVRSDRELVARFRDLARRPDIRIIRSHAEAEALAAASAAAD
ncbi:MAG TPA: glycosyltransferase [Acidobacteriota bacterium]|jgi:GT2 family glycosyltransferase|nr:glycosyltransferase [Acidobacteriota bacterium]HNU01389.1 glycosyltransferase [Acidobacteriota bacterium]HQO26640.1 glycosyltransferase [Acidobacteriota bacterium]